MRLLHGDCLDLMKSIEDNSIDLILTDLPYGTTSCKWDTIIPFEPLWTEWLRVIKPGRAIISTANQPFTSMLITSNIKMFKHNWVWKKSRSGSAITAKFCPVKRHEDIIVFGKGKILYNPQMTQGKPYYRKYNKHGKNDHNFGINQRMEVTNSGTRYPITVIDIKQNWARGQEHHPTQKPVELMEYLIKTYSNEGDTILDNCMGSGTTGIACINTGRKFIGIEKDEKYFDIAKKRIQEYCP